MAYPNSIYASIIMCSSRECGPVGTIMDWDDTALVPTYRMVVSGAINYAKCWQVDLGEDGLSWNLTVRIQNTNPCYGWRYFGRVEPEDDPTGDYAILVQGVPDVSYGQANVVSMDYMGRPEGLY